jgi:hypothetical protein
MAQIYLDCDGVLADFDSGAKAILGLHPVEFEKRYGPKRFWNALSETENFFMTLDPLPDAMALYRAVKHLKPIILTGLPHGIWAEPQKRAWAEKHFPGVEVITTRAALKREYCRPGDVLVDDRDKYRPLWEEAGGIFIHHKSAKDSIRQLEAKGFL